MGKLIMKLKKSKSYLSKAKMCLLLAISVVCFISGITLAEGLVAKVEGSGAPRKGGNSYKSYKEELEKTKAEKRKLLLKLAEKCKLKALDLDKLKVYKKNRPKFRNHKLSRYLDIKDAARLEVYEFMLSLFRKRLAGRYLIFIKKENDISKMPVWELEMFVEQKHAISKLIYGIKLFEAKCNELKKKAVKNKSNKNFKRSEKLDFPSLDTFMSKLPDSLGANEKFLWKLAGSAIRWRGYELKYGQKYSYNAAVSLNLFELNKKYLRRWKRYQKFLGNFEEVTYKCSPAKSAWEFEYVQSCMNYANNVLRKGKNWPIFIYYDKYWKLFADWRDKKNQATKAYINSIKAEARGLISDTDLEKIEKEIQDAKEANPFVFKNGPRKYKQEYLAKKSYIDRLMLEGNIIDCFLDANIKISNDKPALNYRQLFKTLKISFENQPYSVIPNERQMAVIQIYYACHEEVNRSMAYRYEWLIKNYTYKYGAPEPIDSSFIEYDNETGIIKKIDFMKLSCRWISYGISEIHFSNIVFTGSKGKSIAVMKDKIRDYKVDLEQVERACKVWEDKKEKSRSLNYVFESKFIVPGKNESFGAKYSVVNGKKEGFSVSEFDKTGKLVKRYESKEEINNKILHPYSYDNIDSYDAILGWLKQVAKTGKRSRKTIAIPSFDEKTGMLQAIDVYSRITTKKLYRREYKILDFGKAMPNYIAGVINLPAGLDKSQISRIELHFYDRRDAAYQSKYLMSKNLDVSSIKAGKLTFKSTFQILLNTLEDKKFQAMTVLIFGKKNKAGNEPLIAVNDGLVKVEISDKYKPHNIKMKSFK